SRYEIERNMLFEAMSNKCADPSRLRRRRAADTQLCIHVLDGGSCYVIKIKISLLLGNAVPKIDVRLVPDFEIPALYFVFPIAIQQMPDKSGHQRGPFLRIFRRRRQGLVPERMRRGISGQFRRHETYFDKWL